MPRWVWAILALIIINLPQGLDSWSNLIAKLGSLRQDGLGTLPMPEIPISLSTDWLQTLATPLGYVIFGAIVGWDTRLGRRLRRLLGAPIPPLPSMRFTGEDGGIFPTGQWMTVYASVWIEISSNDAQLPDWLLASRICWKRGGWFRRDKVLLRESWDEAVVNGEPKTSHDPWIIPDGKGAAIFLKFNAMRQLDIFEPVPKHSRLILELEVQGMEPIRQPLWSVRLKDWDHPADCHWIGPPIQQPASPVADMADPLTQ